MFCFGNGGLCHGEQKANSHESGKNGLKMFVVVEMFLQHQYIICNTQTHRLRRKDAHADCTKPSS